MRTGIVVAVCAAMMLLGGCGPDQDAGEPGAESSVVEPRGSGSGSGQGSTMPDAPVSGDTKGSAELPSLPIGGNASFEPGSSSTCAFLAWNGGKLPAGVVVRIADLGFPAGISQDTSAPCDGPPCLGADSFTPTQQTCTLGLVWDGSPPADAEPAISATGALRCESQDVCDQVKADAEAAGGVASVQLPELPESPPSTGATESTDPTEPASESP